MCMDDPRLKLYSYGPKYHHESLNGTGYPEGLTRKDIPFECQIIKIADEFDAIVSKRQYKSHVGVTDTLKILIEEAQSEVPKSIALKTIEENTKIGKLNPKIVKALFKVVVEDIEYEISCILDYIKYLGNEIKRLEKINEYDAKMNNSKREKQKTYFENGMKLLFQGGENFRNYKYVLEEYRTAYFKRKEITNNLFEEIKIIKKLKV